MLTAIVESVNVLRHDFYWRRLFVEDTGVIGNGWFACRAEEDGHIFANILRFIVVIIFSPIYYIIPRPVAILVKDFIFPSWRLEKVDVPKSILVEAPSGGRGYYHEGQFRPRWLIKVTFSADGTRTVVPTGWTDDVTRRGYIALSYSYRNAHDLFHEQFPHIPPDAIPSSHYASGPDPPVFELMKGDPLMVAWKEADNKNLGPEVRKLWKDIALRQRDARIFLDRYLDAVTITGTSPSVQYVWLDEFCLFSHDQPDLIKRRQELGRLSDIFGSSTAVCVYCPRNACNHTNQACDWGNRLWTLSEILHTNNVITLTRTRISKGMPWIYTLTPGLGRDFRAGMQHEAALNRQWHLYAIMQHANNSGSPTWQHAIHALVVEAIRRNIESKETNKFLAKALNGLLPRRARPEDLLGEDGWTDLAWLLELNQGFYNAASLAAVCSLGESKVQGRGWLGPPISPSEGNERLEPIVIAFPVPNGLNILNPRIIGLREELKRDVDGLYRNREVRALKWTARLLPFLFIIIFSKAHKLIPAGFAAGLVLSALINLIGSTLYVEKAGCVVLKNELWEGGKAHGCHSPETYLGRRDSRLADLDQWGPNQLVPKWNKHESQAATLVDIGFDVRADFHFRSGKKPNALVPLAVHGCGVTCLVLHHHDNPFKPAYKLGIVNMPPYVLTQGEIMGSLIVGAVPEEVLPPLGLTVWPRETLNSAQVSRGVSTPNPFSPIYSGQYSPGLKSGESSMPDSPYSSPLTPIKAQHSEAFNGRVGRI